MWDLNVNNNRSGKYNVYTFCSIFILFKIKDWWDEMKDFNFLGIYIIQPKKKVQRQI